jgi:hypothetical protein
MRDFDSVTVHDTVEGNPAWVFFDVTVIRDARGYPSSHRVDFSSIYIQGKGWQYGTLMSEGDRLSMAFRYGEDAIRLFEESNRRLQEYSESVR